MRSNSMCFGPKMPVLGGSWVVICGLISRVTIVITHIKGLITPLRTTHEPPSIGTTLKPKHAADASLVSQSWLPEV